MNKPESETYIRLKFFPPQTTKEYVYSLPIEVVEYILGIDGQRDLLGEEHIRDTMYWLFKAYNEIDVSSENIWLLYKDKLLEYFSDKVANTL